MSASPSRTSCVACRMNCRLRIIFAVMRNCPKRFLRPMHGYPGAIVRASELCEVKESIMGWLDNCP